MILVYNADDQPVRPGDVINIHEMGNGRVTSIDSVLSRVFVTAPTLPGQVMVHPKNIGARWVEGDAEPTLDDLFANLQKAQAAYHAALSKEMKKWPA